jgi:hypothetical protein
VTLLVENVLDTPLTVAMSVELPEGATVILLAALVKPLRVSLPDSSENVPAGAAVWTGAVTGGALPDALPPFEDPPPLLLLLPPLRGAPEMPLTIGDFQSSLSAPGPP